MSIYQQYNRTLSTRREKTEPFTITENLLKRMTNYENSQWMRHGGPAYYRETGEILKIK